MDFTTMGLVDLHFHGAFGIDLMRASPGEMDSLADRLSESGIAAFCPTTLSVALPELRETVSRLGRWISTAQARSMGAWPIGIHLEGPFINPAAAGAHPPGVLKPATPEILEDLWNSSGKTIRLITLAPEIHEPGALQAIVAWARSRKITLSLGHSLATEAQAREAFGLGFRNLTHAWNAMPWHHRKPGPLGAAIGHPDVFIELIIDGIHVADAPVRWTCACHPRDQICFVSDCVPSAALPAGQWTRFGPLQIQTPAGDASRLPDGSLAGGGSLLSEMYCQWLTREAGYSGAKIREVLTKTLPRVTRNPLRSLGFDAVPKPILNRKVKWTLSGTSVTLRPAKSH